MSKPVRHLCAHGRELVTRLRAFYQPGMSHKAFATAILKDGEERIGVDVWHRLMSDTYTGNTEGYEKLMARIVARLDAQQKALRRAARPDDLPFSEDELVLSIMGALRKTTETSDEMRMVIFQGYDGDGKSALREHIMFGQTERAIALRAQFAQVHAIECNPCWRLFKAATSYLAGLFGDKGPHRDTATALASLTELARSAGTTLIILEEFQYASSDTWNLLKWLCNQTNLTFLILTHPDLFREMQKRSWMAVDQGHARSLYTAGPRVYSADTVRPFLSACGVQGEDLELGSKLVADAAQARHGFRRIREVCMFLRGMPTSGAPTFAHVKSALKKALANKGASPAIDRERAA